MINSKIYKKYLSRIDDLIKKGGDVPIKAESVGRLANFVTGERSYRQVYKVDWEKFIEWRTNCITLLDNIIPHNSIHRETIKSFQQLKNSKDQLEFGISFLKSIKEDLQNGFLDDLYLKVEAELSSDYMGQAELLLHENVKGQFDYVPAAVLSGAVLEKALKTICKKLDPPESITKNNGKPIMMDALISCLKKRGVFNEIAAKQLRTWAGIRNSAAHGEFNEFNKTQVQNMVTGIQSFLVQYLS